MKLELYHSANSLERFRSNNKQKSIYRLPIVPEENNEPAERETSGLFKPFVMSSLPTTAVGFRGYQTPMDYPVEKECDEDVFDETWQQRHLNASHPMKRTRRHTLGEIHRPHFFSNGNEFFPPSNEQWPTSSGNRTLQVTPHNGALSPMEAERKRSAFLRYLKDRYPQHADVISGKRTQEKPPLTLVRTRASYAADNSYFNSGHTSSSNDSDLARYGSLSRGGRLRSSLPIIRSRSRSRERPLGIIYLEYSGESRPSILPNELTSLDTIRALFVHSYPGLLTMPMLDPQKHSLLLKNKKTGTYDEIDSVSRIKDRSVIRTRPTGIPTPGNKKSTVQQNSKLSGQNNRTSNRVPQQSPEDVAVAEKNQKNLNHKSGLKAPVKSLIRQYQAAPGLIKQAVSGSIPASGDVKSISKLPPKSHDSAPKSVKARAPPPPPRSGKPPIPTPAPKPNGNGAITNITPNGSLRSGNGHGGGSVPHKGFSYMKADLPDDLMNDKNESFSTETNASNNTPIENNSINKHKGLKHPSYSSSPAEGIRKNTSNKPPGASLEQSRQLGSAGAEREARPKTPINLQPRQYAGSAMASQTKFSSVTTQSDSSGSKLIVPKGLQARMHGLKQPNNQNSKITLRQTVLIPDSIKQPTDEVNNQSKKVSSSPECRTNLNATGSSGVYNRACRPSKGLQPKPFSIPVVPDVNPTKHDQQNDRTAKHNENGSALAPSNSYINSLSSLSSDFNVTASQFAGASSEGEKNRPSVNKLGLFGLRKLVSNKTTPHLNSDSNIKASTDEKLKVLRNSNELLVSREDKFSASACSISSDRSVSSETNSNLSVPRLQSKIAPKPSPLSTRKAVIPKTDQLSSLLTNTGIETKPRDSSNSSIDHASIDVASNASNSDNDKDHDASTSPVGDERGLTGVLKNSSLVKSTSTTSILTDSGASNLSTTPSLKIKKVSFQDDVTVCDSNGISTFSNGLRNCDADDTANGNFSFHTHELDQSLSSDINEQEQPFRCDNDALRSWRNESSNRGSNIRREPNLVSVDRYRSPTPRIGNITQNDNLSSYYPPSHLTYQPQNSNYSRLNHQSAVAAAIQSISSNSIASSKAKQSPRNYEEFSVSCASPVPMVMRQERVASPYKEEWCPLRRNTTENAVVASDGLLAQQQYCTTPVSAPRLKDAVKSGDKPSDGTKVIKESELSYFQTQGAVVTNINPSNEPFHPDTPPYYECCEPKSAQSITPSRLNEALELRSTADVTPSNTQPRGGAQVVSLPLDNERALTMSDSLLAQSVDSADSKQLPNNRMSVMERQLASLTGMVESIITSADNSQLTGTESVQSHSAIGKNADSSYLGSKTLISHDMRQQFFKLRETAHELKEQLNDLKRQQRFNMEHMNDLVNEKTRDLTQFIASTAGAQHRPLRMRRIRLDQDRHAYGMNASRTEKQLSDVEAAVEELRNEVVERRCRVNAREVEALVLQLSQAGRTVAQLKGSYPALCDELRTVGAAETEVIYAEEKFVEAEPSRLDEQLKRCKQLTSTLFTLKKLATVQEARSKTPTSFAQIRPNTPTHMMHRAAWEDPNVNRRRVLDDVRRIRVDNNRRMESIQEAEVRWSRRRKFIRELDSKKLEKALEMAEKALNRTDYASKIEKRRRDHLVEMYNKRATAETVRDTNLTTSESSSIESLPPPPLPEELPDHAYSSIASHITSHTKSNQSGLQHPTDLHLSTSARPSNYSVISPDVGYLSSDLSPEMRNQNIPRNNTGSLPRPVHQHHPGHGFPSGRSFHSYSMTPDSFHLHSGRETPAHHIPRPRSATPHQWNTGSYPSSHYTNIVADAQEMNEDERRRILQQQSVSKMEKNQRLKEQYSKLQQMQKRQRMSMKKPSGGSNNNVPSGMYHPMSISPAAKSSDV